MLFAVWVVTRLLIFFKISYTLGLEADIEIYFKYAAEILRGLVPYRDFAIEYPPGALPFFLLPKLLAGDVFSYRRFFVAEVMLVDFIGLLLILYYGRKHGFSPRHVYFTGLLYVVLPAVIGLVGYQRFDFIPAVLVLGAIILLDKGYRVWAWALLGLGFAVKLYPVILTPVFLISAWREKSLKRDVLYGLPVFALTAAVVWLPFLAAAGPKFWFFLSYHASRGIQLESFYSTILLVARWFGYPVSTEFSYGSWNVVSQVSPVLAKMSFFVMGTLMSLVLVHSLAVAQNGSPTDGDIPRQALLMVMAFIIGGKVLSPQYLLWLIPLLVIALREDSRYRRKVWVAFALLTLISFLIYPVNYKGLIDLRLWPSLLILARNGLLLAVFYLLLKNGSVNRQPRKASET